MTDPICVESRGAAEAEDLVETLMGRGIRARLLASSGRFDVEIGVEPPESERPSLEAIVALEAWLTERGRPSIPIRVGERHYELRPHPNGAEGRRRRILGRLWRRLRGALR